MFIYKHSTEMLASDKTISIFHINLMEFRKVSDYHANLVTILLDRRVLNSKKKKKNLCI